MRTSRLINEVGNRYGNLLVVGSGSRRRTTQMWSCRCDCGRLHEVNGSNLRSGDVRSCGHCGLALLPGDEAAFRQALNNYRKNARTRGIAFELSAEQFRSVSQKNCHYCGSSPANKHKPARPRAGADSFVYSGLDRVDNTRGYLDGNVVPCCALCNSAKSALSVDEFLKWVSRVAKHSADAINLLYRD